MMRIEDIDAKVILNLDTLAMDRPADSSAGATGAQNLSAGCHEGGAAHV